MDTFVSKLKFISHLTCNSLNFIHLILSNLAYCAAHDLYLFIFPLAPLLCTLLYNMVLTPFLFSFLFSYLPLNWCHRCSGDSDAVELQFAKGDLDTGEYVIERMSSFTAAQSTVVCQNTMLFHFIYLNILQLSYILVTFCAVIMDTVFLLFKIDLCVYQYRL